MTICYAVGLAVRIFPATMRTFTKDTALSEQGRGAAWHVWINARHGRGTAWARHAMCQSAFTYTWLETSRRYQYLLSFIRLQINIDSSDLCKYRLAHLLQTSGCWLLTSHSDMYSVAHAVILKTSECYEQSAIKLECSPTELKAGRRKPFGVHPEGLELIGSPDWWIVTGGQTVLALTRKLIFIISIRCQKVNWRWLVQILEAELPVHVATFERRPCMTSRGR